MGIIQDRLSTELRSAEYLDPDGRDRSTIEDYEDGPIYIEDTSEGLQYQAWRLHWSGGNFTLYPEDVGSPVSLTPTAQNVTQVTLAFDQNAHATVGYVINSNDAYLYWYDTAAQGFVTTHYPGYTGFMLSLDDKRTTQTNSSDILLWYTRQEQGQYNLYTRKQRDRFLIEYLMLEDSPTYVKKAGMHKGLRGQVALSYSKWA